METIQLQTIYIYLPSLPQGSWKECMDMYASVAAISPNENGVEIVFKQQTSMMYTDCVIFESCSV